MNYEIRETWHEDFITYLASQIRPNVYVELGLRHCAVFNRIIPFANTLIGVDIAVESGQYMMHSDKTTFVNSTTDQFAETLKNNPISIDMLFIDADHAKEAVLRDFFNFYPFINDQGLILLHDTYPGSIEYTNVLHCADAYRAAEELKKYQDEFGFEMATIPVHPGLTIVRKRKSQISWK